MATAPSFLRLNPDLDQAKLQRQFKRDQRIQIRDLIEQDGAVALVKLLIEQTPWGMSWQAGADGPHRLRQEDLPQLAPEAVQRISAKLNAAMQGQDFAFIYSQYRMYAAHHEGWSKSPGHDLIVQDLNRDAFLDFIRSVTGVPEIRVCDAQASHYGPGQFLSLHQDISDEDENEDRLVAYVLNLCPDRWRPDWGGYLNFFNEDGDIVCGYMPRFNSLNLFRVPRHHNVSLVAPFAAGNRLAITGWFRSR